MALAHDVGTADLELVEVGHHTALFRPDTHAVALLNESAAAWCQAMLGGAAMADDAAGLLGDLRRAGFIGEAQCPRAGAPERATVTPEGDGLPPLGVYRLGSGPRVRLAVALPSLASLLTATLCPLGVATTGHADTSITVAGSAQGFGVWRDGVAIGLDLDVGDARRIVLQAMLMALHAEGTIAAILHASTVVTAGGAVVLAGASGSGKSTLALALVATGAAHLADDFTALGVSGRAVLGFPVAASVKQGSWPLLAERFPGLRHCLAHAVGDRTVRYLNAGAGSAPPPATAAVGVLIFPTFTSGATPASERLSPEAALGRLLASGSEVVGWPRSLRPMAELVNCVPSWSLSFGNLDEAVDGVRALAGETNLERIAS